MSAMIQAIRDRARRRWSTIDEPLAVAAALKEASAETDRTLTNRLEAEHAKRKGGTL
jgi:hypothetical protein